MIAGLPTATVVLDPQRHRGPIDDRLFGSFVEHMGRCVYTGHLRTRPPDRRRLRLPRRRRRPRPRTRRHGRALPGRQLRVRLPTGATASARRTTARAASISPGARSRRTRSAPTSSCSGRAPRHRTDDGGQPRHRGILEAAATSSNTATSRAARRGPTCGVATAPPTPTASQLWCLGNEMDGPWQTGHIDRRRVRPRSRLRRRNAMRLRRPDDRTGRVRQLGPRHAHLRLLGVDRPRAQLRRRRLHVACTPTTTSATATAGASLPRVRRWTASSTTWSPRSTRSRRASTAASASTSPSTNGTSGTSPVPRARRRLRHRRLRPSHSRTSTAPSTPWWSAICISQSAQPQRPGARSRATRSWSTSSRRS